MKTIKNILFLSLFVSSAMAQGIQTMNQIPEGQVLFLQNPSFKTRVLNVQDGGIQTVNSWNFLEDLGFSYSSLDSIKTRSFMGPEGQGFNSYGGTSFVTRAWMMQTTWTKIFPSFSIPDVIFLDCRFVRGEITRAKRVSMRIAVQNLYGYSLLIDKTIPVDSMWTTLSWNMLPTKIFGIKSIVRFYLLIQFYSDDLNYVGADIMIRNLGGIDSSGKSSFIDFPVVVTAVPEVRIPELFTLEQNYPNPFNPSTTIRYSVPQSGEVSLKVFNLLGEEVATLFTGVQQAGNHTVRFNGSNLASGMYLYRLQMGNLTETKKFVLLK